MTTVKTTLAALVLILAACVATEVTESFEERSQAPTTQATVAQAPKPTSAATSTTTVPTATNDSAPTEPQLVDPNVIGVWPYRTGEEVLKAAVDGIHVNEVDLIERFLADQIGWELGPIIDGRDGTDFMSFTFDSSGGTFYAATEIVGYSPDGSAVVAISSASSLDFLEDGWGPGVDVGESEEGWSAIVSATSIDALLSRPNVMGPFARVSYGEWVSELVLIGTSGASIAIPFEPAMPGVLSVWYFAADDSVAGFSLYALPPGAFVAG